MPESKSPRVRRPNRHIQVHGAKEEDNTWLLVYLDVITLLLILFIVLLILLDPDPDDQPPGEGLLSGTPFILDGDPNILEGMPDIRSDLAAELAAQFDLPADHFGEDQLDLILHEDSVSFRFDDDVLFDVGAAELQPAGAAAINQLLPILRATDARMSVEGHTDNVPISTAQFPSNWELSSARASSVVRHLVGQGIAPDRMRAIGYGDTEPIARNNTAEGRAMNRRVEITIHFGPGQSLEDLPVG